MRRPLLVAWAPAAVLGSCLAVAAAIAATGHRALEDFADAQLALAGGVAAHQLESLLVARVRTLEGVGALDAAFGPGPVRAAARRAAIGGLMRTHPEFVWVAFADAPGRLDVASPGEPAPGARSVAAREWWRAAQRGPFLGGPHPAPTAEEAAGEGMVAGGGPRLLDIAVPLRQGAAEPYGVLAAQVDPRWLVAVCQELERAFRPHLEVDLAFVRRDGRPVVGKASTLAGPGDPAEPDGPRQGMLAARHREVAVHPIEGDVVVSRLAWRAVIGRDPGSHAGAAQRYVAQALAIGAVVGLLGALVVMAAGRRARDVRPPPAP